MSLLRRFFAFWLPAPPLSEAPTEKPAPLWGSHSCDKCGQLLGGVSGVIGGVSPLYPHPEPTPKYANDSEHGERLLWTCPRCGYRWATAVLRPKTE